MPDHYHTPDPKDIGDWLRRRGKQVGRFFNRAGSVYKQAYSNMPRGAGGPMSTITAQDISNLSNRKSSPNTRTDKIYNSRAVHILKDLEGVLGNTDNRSVMMLGEPSGSKVVVKSPMDPQISGGVPHYYDRDNRYIPYELVSKGSGAIIDSLSLGPAGTQIQFLTAGHAGPLSGGKWVALSGGDGTVYNVNRGATAKLDPSWEIPPEDQEFMDMLNPDYGDDWQAGNFVIPRGDPNIKAVRLPPRMQNVAQGQYSAEAVGHPYIRGNDELMDIDLPYNPRDQLISPSMVNIDSNARFKAGSAPIGGHSGSGLYDINTGNFLGLLTSSTENFNQEESQDQISGRALVRALGHQYKMNPSAIDSLGKTNISHVYPYPIDSVYSPQQATVMKLLQQNYGNQFNNPFSFIAPNDSIMGPSVNAILEGINQENYYDFFGGMPGWYFDPKEDVWKNLKDRNIKSDKINRYR